MSEAQAQMPRFIVVGYTSSLRSSKPIIYKCKDLSRELRDVFAVGFLTSAARRFYVFRVVDEVDEDTWYLISFDIKYVYTKKTAQRTRPHKEYTKIKEEMFSRGCGHVDASTYVCPEDSSDVPKDVADTDPEAVRVEVWPVKPHDERTREYMRQAVLEAVNYYKTAAQPYVVFADRKLRGGGIQKAEELLDVLQMMLAAPWRSKVERLIGSDPFAELEALRRALERALQERAAKRGSGEKKPKQAEKKTQS